MIKVLVVDDSLVQRELLLEVLNSDPEIKVIDTAVDGEEAVAKAIALKPDVITMDIHLPKMNGIEATRKIMSIAPIPIIIISASTTETETTAAFDALEAGAVAISEKINFLSETKDKLIQTVKLMSEVKVIKRHERLRSANGKLKVEEQPHKALDVKVIGIGVSTGGPPVLRNIFDNLPSHFPPIVVVQHITPGFLQGLVDWLKQTAKAPIKVATFGEALVPNQIYFAPEEYQMSVDMRNCVVLSKGEPENGHRPSVSFLFRSLAKNVGSNAVGILLTGMGHDGAEGLKLMKESGAHTIAQDEETSTIFGMPGEAIAIGGASQVLSIKEIINFINNPIQLSL